MKHLIKYHTSPGLPDLSCRFLPDSAEEKLGPQRGLNGPPRSRANGILQYNSSMRIMMG